MAHQFQTYWIENDKLSDLISDMLKEGYPASPGASENDLFFRAQAPSANGNVRSTPGKVSLRYDGPHNLMLWRGREGADILYRAARHYFDLRNLTGRED